MGRPSPDAFFCSTSIANPTMKRSKKIWKTNPAWRPYHLWVQGERHRICTDSIQSEIIDPVDWFRTVDYKIPAMTAFLTKHQRREELTIIPDFQASKSFVDGFKARRNLSSRRQCFRRRPKSDDASRIERWKNEIAGISASTPLQCILNRDETSWRLIPNRIGTWAELETDGLQIHANGDAKASMIARATISTAGCKFPFHYLAKGRTLLCEEIQIGDVADHGHWHSDNG
jgi:hypothetical protein